MAQIEVYEWLKKQRLSGNEAFFSIKEVRKGLKEEGNDYYNHIIRRDLVKLCDYGYLEARLPSDWSDWVMKFRIKSKYIEQLKQEVSD